MSQWARLFSTIVFLFLSFAHLPAPWMVALSFPAVSATVPADDPACVNSRECMPRVYRAVERELLQRYPRCIGTWSYQYPTREGGRNVVVVTVRCTRILGERS